MPVQLSTRRRRAVYIVARVGSYALIAVVGALAMLYPDTGDLPGWALWISRTGGGFAMLGGIACAYAAARERWLIELQVLWLIGLGISALASVLIAGLMVHVLSGRHWLMFALTLAAIVGGLAARGTHLSDRAGLRTKAKGDGA